jgi:hypothetical protein
MITPGTKVRHPQEDEVWIVTERVSFGFWLLVSARLDGRRKQVQQVQLERYVVVDDARQEGLDL